MNKENKINRTEDKKTIIGILLTMPLYMLILMALRGLGLNEDGNEILFITLMYAPIFAGLILSLLDNNIKSNNELSIIIFILILVGLYFFYNAFFVDGEGYEGLGSYLLWILTNIICRITGCIYYGTIVGAKKGIIFFVISFILVVSSVLLGFWA